MVSVKLEL